MTFPTIQDLYEKSILSERVKEFDQPSHHLKYFIQEPDRFRHFSIGNNLLFFDFSRQRIDERVLNLLFSVAQKTGSLEMFKEMMDGAKVNYTEQRAALHTCTRDFDSSPVMLDQENVKDEIVKVNEKIKQFSMAIHLGALKGSSGKTFTQAVIIGIGGSYLGTDFVWTALQNTIPYKLKLYFLSNVDIDNFGAIIRHISPDRCLFIVVSKSYRTRETIANLEQVKLCLKKHNLRVKDHIVTITAKGSPGDLAHDDQLASFHMFDFIGGRYSVTSAVGGLPLSLAFGYKVFERFLKGCHKMDIHTRNTSIEQNIPLIAALINIWNFQFINYPAMAIVPYASGLSKLVPHIQQLYMESLGKMVDRKGKYRNPPGGGIIFGGVGTNVQHSFFQMAHQGALFPIEFIGILNPAYKGPFANIEGIDNHQELWANLIAQAQVLAIGNDDHYPYKHLPGNRPSSIIVLNDQSPESIGILLAFYEARTVLEGFILGINPFDQFGVESGKKLAASIRQEINVKNKKQTYEFDTLDSSQRFYLNTLFKGSLF